MTELAMNELMGRGITAEQDGAARAAPAGAIRDDVPSRVVAGSNGRRVLVVDDERAVVRLMKLRLENLGYRVSDTTDSRRAVELVRASPDAFDVVITDYQMPHLRGTELAIELRRLRSDLGIVLASGYLGALTDAEVSMFDVALPKPHSTVELNDALRHAFHAARAVH